MQIRRCLTLKFIVQVDVSSSRTGHSDRCVPSLACHASTRPSPALPCPAVPAAC